MRTIVAFFTAGFLLFFVSTNAGCPNPPAPLAPVISCTEQNLDQIEALLKQFAGLLVGDSPDWAAIEAQAEAAGVQIGGCALSEFVNQYLSAKSVGGSAAVSQSWIAHDTLEHFRTKMAPGATFKTAAGNL